MLQELKIVLVFYGFFLSTFIYALYLIKKAYGRTSHRIIFLCAPILILFIIFLLILAIFAGIFPFDLTAVEYAIAIVILVVIQNILSFVFRHKA